MSQLPSDTYLSSKKKFWINWIFYNGHWVLLSFVLGLGVLAYSCKNVRSYADQEVAKKDLRDRIDDLKKEQARLKRDLGKKRKSVAVLSSIVKNRDYKIEDCEERRRRAAEDCEDRLQKISRKAQTADMAAERLKMCRQDNKLPRFAWGGNSWIMARCSQYGSPTYGYRGIPKTGWRFNVTMRFESMGRSMFLRYKCTWRAVRQGTVWNLK